jgi:hypothetical protein
MEEQKATQQEKSDQSLQDTHTHSQYGGPVAAPRVTYSNIIQPSPIGRRDRNMLQIIKVDYGKHNHTTLGHDIPV